MAVAAGVIRANELMRSAVFTLRITGMRAWRFRAFCARPLFWLACKILGVNGYRLIEEGEGQ